MQKNSGNSSKKTIQAISNMKIHSLIYCVKKKWCFSLCFHVCFWSFLGEGFEGYQLIMGHQVFLPFFMFLFVVVC